MARILQIKPPKISETRWERFKPVILNKRQTMTIDELVKYMKREYSFCITPRQLRYRIQKRWADRDAHQLAPTTPAPAPAPTRTGRTVLSRPMAESTPRSLQRHVTTTTDPAAAAVFEAERGVNFRVRQAGPGLNRNVASLYPPIRTRQQQPATQLPDGTVVAAKRPVAATELPAPGEFCLGYWDEQRGRGYYIVLVLPWKNLSRIFSQRKREQLFLPIPKCYNSKGLSINGWASGYQDGDESIAERQVPVMWHDQELSFGWLHARDISRLPSNLCDPFWEERDDWGITLESIASCPLSVTQCLRYVEKLLQSEPRRTQPTAPKASSGATSVVAIPTRQRKQERRVRKPQKSRPASPEKAQMELDIQQLKAELFNARADLDKARADLDKAREDIKSLEECLYQQ